jgi:CysZ protein
LSAVSAFLGGTLMAFTEPQVRGKLVVGFIANAVLFAALLAGLWFGLGLIEIDGGSWLGDLLSVVLRVLVVGIALLWAPVIFMVLADLVMPAVETPVFEAARAAAGAAPLTGEISTAASVGLEIKRLGRFAGASLAALLLNLLPGIGTVLYLAVQFGLTARELGWDLLGAHMEGHGLDYRAQVEFVAQNRAAVFAVGTVATVLVLIPVAQLVFVTSNYAGAGAVSARIDRR